jgi:hypothetical protein
VKIRISFRRLYSDLCSEKMMRNREKWLKTYLHNASIYFSHKSFPQNINILGEITAKRYDHEFVSISGGYLSAYFLSKW